METKNIKGVKSCFGCGVCTAACPKNIIHIKLNKKGFYVPEIVDESLCIQCGLCKSVCSFCHKELSSEPEYIKAYAGWSNDSETRRTCSSGGVAYEISKMLIERGFKVVAARYVSEKNIVEHYVSTSIQELEASKGSKYLQSNTEKAFREVDKKDKYLVVGTPCQIDSFRRYIHRMGCENNFVLMDFFCHGVPSKLMWNKYIREKEKLIGNIRKVTWRNKTTGWQDSWNMHLESEDSKIESRLSQGDEFYKLFLSDTCLGKACYINCKYKLQNSSADIRVGDLWGSKYRTNQLGVSGVVVFNKTGYDVLNQADCTIIPHDFEVVAKDQTKENPKQTTTSIIISYLLRFDFITCKMLLRQLRLSRIIRSIFIHIVNPSITYQYIKRKFVK